MSIVFTTAAAAAQNTSDPKESLGVVECAVCVVDRQVNLFLLLGLVQWITNH